MPTRRAIDPDQLDAKVRKVQSRSGVWKALSIERKIELLHGFRERTAQLAEKQVHTALREKGLEPGTPPASEEWVGGPVATLRTTRHFLRTLNSIRETGQPPLPENAVRERPNGQLAAEVFPGSAYDRLLYPGVRVEVWTDSEVSREELFRKMGALYRDDVSEPVSREPPPEGEASLVLGAGNVAALPPLDVIHKLYAEGRTCILKLNPVNDYLGPFFERRFGEFIEEGFVQIAYGGAETGDYLCRHEGIDQIHITGSDKTHDAIVFGTGEEGRRRKRNNNPRLQKPITSELGNVSPVIVAPGPWSEGDLQFHAENIASQVVTNAGFNCLTARVVVTPSRWDKREALLGALEEAFRRVEPREAYYPGAEDQFERFVAAEGDVRLCSARQAGEGELPWALLREVDPEAKGHPAFTEEHFCGAIAETALSGDTALSFLKKAVSFCNEQLWGTLNASIILHPETRKELGSDLEELVSDLNYGTVGINHSPGVSWLLGVAPWGAPPGHTLQDIQSGIGKVQNSLLFEKPQKSVLDGPFRPWGKPPWFFSHENAHRVAATMVDFEHDPSVSSFLRAGWWALRP